MAGLTADRFAEFFQAVWGQEPFPWQVRLARRVIEQGWPDLLDLPTGVGKTAAIDVALYALASDEDRAPSERTAPRRIVMVVDRRVIVDQAHRRAVRLRNALAGAVGGVVAEVASALKRMSASDRSLATPVLRGGVPRDDDWSRDPSQPLVAVSTVDQVGSRLLFRGYGVSKGMRPVHAGLLGNDTLFLLDEVHLSIPFAETLANIQRHYLRSNTIDMAARWRVVQLSATPAAPPSEIATFQLDVTDERHEVLAKRLSALKPTRLAEPVIVRKTGGEPEARARLAEACTREAVGLVRAGRRRVAVVVNRVDTARLACRELQSHAAEFDVELVTGRMRPLDKDEVVERVLRRVSAEVTADASGLTARPFVLVATQCIEAGADFDFDGLVTECASWDALRQRFGRLNRRGTANSCQAVVLVRSDQVASNAPADPVYGEALRHTWAWLGERHSDLDLGIGAAPRPSAEELRNLVAPHPNAPVLLPGHLDLWSQTNPGPFPDPEVSHWLHGPERGSPEVSLVWRADVAEDRLAAAASDREVLTELIDLVSTCPPSSIETLPVPLHAARAWLTGGEADVPDVEGQSIAEAADRALRPGRPALAWRADDSVVVTARELRPGDVLIVPSTYGGVSNQTWDPAAQEPVRDLGDEAQLVQRGRATLRLDARVLQDRIRDFLAEHPIPAPPGPNTEVEAHDREDPVGDWLERLAAVERDPLPAWIRVAATRLMIRSRQRRFARGGVFHLVDRRTERFGMNLDDTLDAEIGAPSTEDDTSACADAPITLAAHSSDVQREAGVFARRCALPPALVADLELAGWLHDVGKADPRFQQWLCGGDEMEAALLNEPLAKSSTLSASDAAMRRRARALSGYPKGARHELLSVALVQATKLRERANDWELVLHLVGSHHGWCRPFAPVAFDDEPVSVTMTHGDAELHGSSGHSLARLDSGVPDRFWHLTRKYGWYGLAWLEAILRLADHRASGKAQRERLS